MTLDQMIAELQNKREELGQGDVEVYIEGDTTYCTSEVVIKNGRREVLGVFIL